MRPVVYVLYGGTSEEREVSLRSGKGVAEALKQTGYQVELYDLNSTTLPNEWDPGKILIFPMLHGTFGEDGALQEKLEQRGFEFVGSGSVSSRLCFDKEETLKIAEMLEVRTAKRLIGWKKEDFSLERIRESIGFPLILKPACQGSSVGLFRIENEEALAGALASMATGKQILEEQIIGREFSVGVVEGKATGIVEICPEGGLYDYYHKYTPGATIYRSPAPVSREEETILLELAERMYAGCQCRDFARVDFLQRKNGEILFLEVNTIPGMTETSLLPKSAQVQGWSYNELIQRMIQPAWMRFIKRAY